MRASGYAVETAAHKVAIISVNSGTSPWRHFRGGATRTAPYGLETIAVGRDRAEEFLTVTSSRAPPTWRWRLDTNGTRPTLGRDGSVRLAGGLRVRPVEILDVAGRTVTPPGLRWSLDRKAGDWFLGLRLDDSKLPLPYVIDPAVDYPATQYLTSSNQANSTTLTAVTAYTLNASAPSSACTKVTNPQPDCVGLKYATAASPYPAYYQIIPGSFNINGTRVAPPSTTPDGKGWIVDLGGAAAPTDTAIPAGTWTFNVHTLANNTSTGGTIHLVAGVWKVTTSGGAITANTNYLDPGSAAAEATSPNLVAVATNQTVNFTASLPEISLTANEHVLVQFYLKQSAAMTTQRTVGIVSGDANSWISHPAATTRPSVPTLQTPTAGLLLKTTTPTLSATFTDAGDTGQVNFRVCSDVNCVGVLQTFSSSSGNASGTTVFAQVPGAMTDNTTYYWQVQGQDAAGVTSAWSAGRAFTVNTAGTSGDVTAPSTPAVTVAQNPASANQYLSGTTLYYKSGGAGGSFDVTATGTTDAESGVHHVAFPAISGVAGGGNVAISPWVKTYTWNNSTSASGAQNVTSVNNAGLTSATAPFTLTPDAAGPSGGSVTYTNGFISTTSVTITTADGADAGAGVDTTTRLIERDSATLTNGTCGSFSGSWTTVTSPNTVTTGNCYVYRFTVADNVGNSTTYTSPSVVEVDTSAPAAPTLSLSESSSLSFVSGTTLFYNAQGSNSGSFTVDATASDAQSGIASVAFPVVFGADSSTDAASPYQATYSWIASSNASGAKTVNTTNNSSLTSGNTSFTVTRDIAAPSGGSVTYANGYNTTGSVTITTADGSDPLSGLDLSSALIERQTTSLANGSCGSFTNPWTTVASPDNTVASGTCAKYRYTISDNVANPVTYTSVNIVKVDTSAPAAPPLTLSEVTGTQWEHVSGTTLYYNAQASNAGSFTVDAAASDAESGITSATFPVVFGADGLTDATSPYQRTYSWTSAAAASGAKNVTALNNAGLTSSNSPFTVTKDIAAPGSGSITYPNGYDTSGSIALTINEGTDALSGIDSPSTLIERNSAPLTNGSCGSYVGWTTVSNPDTTVATGNCYQYRVTVKDNVGNTAAPYTSANVVKEDQTAPTGPTLSLSESSALEFVSGSTLFYNPQGSNSGSFTVNAVTSDGESTVSSVGFPVVFGADSSSDPSSPYSATYSWNSSASASGQKTVTATNGAALQSTDTFTVTPDTAGPGGGSVSYTNSFISTTSVTVTTADGADAGAGVDTTTRLLERDAIALTNGSCGSFTGAWTTVSSPDNTVASGNCYVYRYTVADKVGNPVTYTSPNVVKVDTSAPAAPALSFGSFTNANATGSTVYFRTGVAGGFTVTATASDAQSGIASRSFPALGSGWSDSPSGADDAYSFTSAAADPVEPNNVSVTNSAGLGSTNTPFTITADGTAPATSVTCNASACSAGWYTSSVTVALSASDGGSGVGSIKYTTDGSDPSPVNGTIYSGSFAVAATTTVKFRAYDAVGNEESVGSQLVRVDAVAPTGSLTAPANGSALRGTVTVSSDSADGNSGVASAAFQRSPAGAGSWTTIATVNSSPYQTSWDTTGVGDGSYNLRVVTTDVAGNLFTSATRTVTVDNTNPSGSLSDPGANLRGSAPLSGSGSDGAGSGVASVSFQRSAAGANSWTTISTDSTSPYTAGWDTTGVGDGLYDLRVLVADAAGNSAASAVVSDRRVDNTAPSGSITAPAAAAAVRGSSVTVSSDSSDSGSGVASVSFERSPAGAGTWTAIASDSSAPYSVSWNSTGVSDGSYDLRAVTTDVAGNSLAGAPVTLSVDNTNPTGSVTAPADGGIVTGSSVAVSSDSADALSGVASVAFQRSAASAGSWTTISSDATSPYSVAFDSTGVTDGTYDLRAITTDVAGNSFTSALVTVTVDNSAPAAPALSYGSFTNASASGSTVYYRPGVSGAFTVTASASDPHSGISSYNFPTLPSGWTPSGSGASRSYSYNGTPTEPGSGQSVTATNGAGLTSPAGTFTVTADSTAPSSSITCNAGACSAGWYTSSVTVALSASDGGSGLSSIRYTTDGSDPSPVNGTVYSGSFSLAASATVKYRAYDAVGNEEAVGSKLARIDSASPTGSLTAPGNGAVVRGTATVSSDSADGNSGVASAAFQHSPAGQGTWTTIATINGSPYQTSWDTTGVSDGSLDVRVVTTDLAGNTFTSSVHTVTVDNASPSGSLSVPGANLRATVSLSANASDATSGVASVAFQRSPAGTGTWTTIVTDNGAPFTAGFDTTGVADGLYDLQVVITDVAGNSFTSAVVANRRVDNTAPGATMTNPGANVRGTITLQSTTSDSGSGVASVGYQYSPSGAGSWTTIGSSSSDPFSLSFNTTTLADGIYDLRTIATDAAGNQTTSSAAGNVHVDNTTPSAAITNPGSPLSGTVTLNSTTNDFGSGIATVAYQSSPGGLGTWTTIATASSFPWSVDWDTTSVGDGRYDLRVIATDAAGNSTTSAATVNRQVSNHPPIVNIIAPSGYVNSTDANSYTITATASGDGAGVTDVQFFRCSNASINCGSGSWVSLGTDTTAPYTATWSVDPAGNRALKAIVTDANNSTGFDVSNVLIDLTAPSGGSVSYLDGYDGSGSVTVTTSDGTDGASGVDPASGFIQRDSATLASGSCDSWANTWSMVSSPDTTVASGSCYRYRYRVSDLAGNTTTYTSGNLLKEDRGAPTTSISDPGANLRTTLTLNGTASDALSGIASVAFQRSPAGAGTWTTIGSDASAPYSVDLNTTAVADGLYDFRTVATDLAGNTGNGTAVTSRRVDNTAPSATTDNPGSPLRATVTLASTISDNGSGVGTITYEYSPAGANSWTATAASWNTTLVADGLYDLHVVVTDVAGNATTSSAVTNVRVDNTGPSVVLDDPGSPIGGSITLGVTASDGGSGLGSVVYERSLVGQNNWTTIGTVSNNPFSLGFDTTAVSDASYDLRAVATDAAGNSTTSALVGSRVIDNTPADVLIGAPADGAYVNSSSPDPFTITASSTDPSVTQVEFFQCSNTSANCSTGSWVSLGTDTTSPYSVSWTLPASDGLRALRAVTTDSANNHGSDTVAVTIDRQAPAGGSASYTDGYAAGAVTVTTDAGSDGVSGVDAASAVLQRDEATLTNGSCDSFSGSWSTVTSPDSTVADGHCYVYRFRVADNAGNLATYTSPNVVKVDTLSPTVTQDDPGANLRGVVALTASAADTGGSGVASVAFQRSAAGVNSWSAIGSDTSAPYSVDFDATAVADGLYDFRTVATDRAGRQTTSAVIAGARVDNTAPTASLDDPGSPLRGTVTLGSQAGDAGSGVASVTYESSPAGAGTWTAIAASWNTTSVSDGLYDLRVVVADVAGNSTASAPVANVGVDNTAPAASLDDPGAYLRDTASLSATASDGGSGLASVAFQRSAAGAGTWTTISTDTGAPYAASFDTTAVADGLYDLRVVATDAAGNQTVSAVVAGRNIDNAAPSASLDAPGSGSYLNATAADPFGLTASTPDSDVSQIEFFACDDASAGCTTGNWVSIGTDASAPYGVSWPLPAGDGAQALKAVATDHAGNSASAVVNVTIDRQAPSGGSISYPNGYGSAPVTITVDGGSDAVSGVDAGSALLERDETTLANGSCDSFAGNWTTVTSPDSSVGSGHCYRYRYTVADDAGNGVTYTTNDVLKVDGGAPMVALDAGVANLRGTVALSATASDALSGVASVVFQRSPAGAGSWTTISTDTSAPFAATFDTTAVADGLYDLRAVATDGAGNTAVDASSRRVDNMVPSGSLTAPADGAFVFDSVAVSSDSADGGSGVASVAFQSSPAGAGSWSAIGSDASSPYSVSLDTSSLADGDYDLRAITTDAAGNSFTSPLRTVTVDNTLSAPTLGFGSFTNAAATGSTVYFRPGASGGFTVTAQPTGVATADQVDFATLGFGWSGGGSDPAAPYEGSYSFNGLAIEPGAGQQVVVVDDAARTSPAATFGVIADGAAPSTSVACGGASCSSGWYSAAVTVSLSATDSASGLAEIRYTADGTVPTPLTGTVYTGAFAVASTATVRYRAYDRVGNEEAVGSQLIRIDGAAPTVSLTDPGNLLSGTVPLAAIASDLGSGVASVTFERSPAGAGSWTPIDTDTSVPYSASLDASALADGLYDLRAVATDAAGNSAVSALATSRVDATAPSVSLDDPGAAVHGTVALSAGASDAGSGIASVAYEYSPAGTNSWTATPASWNTSTLDEGMYDLRARATDVAGNSAYSAVETVQVDNTAPVAAMDDPGSPLDGTVTLTSHSNDSGSGLGSEVFQYSPATTDSWTSLGGADWDTSAVPQGRYDVRVVVTDVAGNVSISEPVRNRAVSSSGVSLTILSPGDVVANADGNPFTIEASSPDAGDLLGVEFFACDNQSVNCSTGSWVSLGTDSTAPYTISWAVPADGNRALRAVATSTSLVQATDLVNTLVDRTAPSGGSVTYAGGFSTGPVTITGTPGSDAGTGVDLASVQIERDEGTLAGGSCSFTGSWQAVSSPDSALASGHCYRYRYRVPDLAGNAAFYTSATVVKTDTGAPTVSLADPGASLHGTAGLDASAADAESGVASVQFQRSPAGAATWTSIGSDTGAPFSLGFDTTAVADGLYDLRAIATDAAGNQTLSALVTGRRVDNSAPDLSFTGPADGARVWGSLPLAATASDAGTGLASIKFRARSGAGAWTTLATQTTPPFDYSWDSTSVPDGPAEIQVLASDALGNQSSVTRAVIVDNVAPTVTLETMPLLVRGLLPLSASASADTTGVLFQLRPHAGSWADLVADSGAPYSAVVDTTALTDGHYDFRAVATDAAGHTTASLAGDVLVDNTAPSGSLLLPGSGVSVSASIVHLVASASDAGSGVVSVTFQQRPASGAWADVAADPDAPYEADWNRTAVPEGAYELRAVLLDTAGNSFATPSTTITLVAGTPPPPPPPPAPFTFSAGKVKLSATRRGKVFLSLPVQLSGAASVQSSLLKGKKTMRKWVNQLPAGKRTLTLGIAKRLLKKGKYTLVLTAIAADGSRVQREVVVTVPAKIKVAKKKR